jgi:hypothetical protein
MREGRLITVSGCALLIALVVVPAAAAQATWLAAEWFWLEPACRQRCATNGKQLHRVAHRTKGGPRARCVCSDESTIPWSGPNWAQAAAMAVFIGAFAGMLFGARRISKSSKTPAAPGVPP